MSLLRWASYLTASVCLSALACDHPVALQVLSESTRLPRGRSSPATSALFDGKTVRLRGARGETLGLELRVSDGQSRVADLSLPSAAARVTGFSVGSLDVREPSTDMYGPSQGRGIYPDVLTPTVGPIRT